MVELTPHTPTHPPPRRVLSADVYGLEPAPHDKTLFPSDHAALKATLEITRAAPLDLAAADPAVAKAAPPAGGGPASSL